MDSIELKEKMHSPSENKTVLTAISVKAKYIKSPHIYVVSLTSTPC